MLPLLGLKTKNNNKKQKQKAPQKGKSINFVQNDSQLKQEYRRIAIGHFQHSPGTYVRKSHFPITPSCGFLLTWMYGA